MNTRRPPRLRAARLPLLRCALALALAFAGACGIEEFPTSMGEGALPGDPLNPWPVETSCDVECTCEGGGGGGGDTDGPAACDAVTFAVEDLAGYAWRFDTLVLTAPLPEGPIADGLNTYFAEEMANGNVNVLLAIDEDDRGTCALDGRLGAGEAAGDGHAYTGEPTAIALTLTNTGFVTAETSALDFPTEQLDPPVLPLRRVALAGTLAPDAAAIDDGTLVAAVTMADAAEVQMMGTRFDQLLTTFAEPDLDLDEDGTNDAWRFEGTFTALRTTLP